MEAKKSASRRRLQNLHSMITASRHSPLHAICRFRRLIDIRYNINSSLAKMMMTMMITRNPKQFGKRPRRLYVTLRHPATAIPKNLPLPVNFYLTHRYLDTRTTVPSNISTECAVFTARRYAKRGICRRRIYVSMCLCVCVCHTPVLCQNG